MSHIKPTDTTPLQWVKGAMGALLVSLVLYVGLASSSACLHEALHDDAECEDQSCVVTTFSKQALDTAPVVPLPWIFNAEEIYCLVPTTDLCFSHQTPSTIHGRAPPDQV